MALSHELLDLREVVSSPMALPNADYSKCMMMNSAHNVTSDKQLPCCRYREKQARPDTALTSAFGI